MATVELDRNGIAKENGDCDGSYVIVGHHDHDDQSPDLSESRAGIGEKRDEIEVDANLKDAKCKVEQNNGAIQEEEEDILGSDVIVDEIREPNVDIFESGLDQPDHKEITAESDLYSGQEKVEDQAKLDFESEQKESQKSDSQTEAVSFDESRKEVQEIGKPVASKKVRESRISQLPTAELVEFEYCEINYSVKEVEEKSKVKSPAQVREDRQIDAKQNVEVEPSCKADGKEVGTAQVAGGLHVEEKESGTEGLADDIPVEAHEEELADDIPVVAIKEELAGDILVDEKESGIKELTDDSPMDAKENGAEVSADDDLMGANENGTEELAESIPVENPSADLETENLNSGISACTPENVQVGVEGRNDMDESGRSVGIVPVERIILETEVINGSAEGQDRISTPPAKHIDSEPLNENRHVENTELPSSAVELKSTADVNKVSSENEDMLAAGSVARDGLEPKAVEDSIERDERISTCSADDVKLEGGLGKGSIEGEKTITTIPDYVLEIETNAKNGVTGSTILISDPVEDLPPFSGAAEVSPASREEFSSTGIVESESLVSNGPNFNGESKPDCLNEGDQSILGDINGKSICEENGIEEFSSKGSLSSSPEDLATGALEGTQVDSEVEKRPFRFLIRIPRYNDDKYKSQLELAQKQVDEKTRNRDDIRSAIQSRRATCGEYRDKVEVARSEERAARDALAAKRREMDSVQSVMNKMKNATSIDDIDDKVRGIEHRIQHETVPLKNEKLLIREMKHLKQLREQLCSSLGHQAEPQPTSDERVKIEDRYKPLKKEMESCRKEVTRLEGIAKAAWKTFSDENEKLKELQAQYSAANDLRQEAYTQLHNIKKQFYEKNKYFRMYKEDAMKAEGYASTRDREALQHLCVNQVESVMELWNNNDEFRNEYVRCNTMSTLRRLGTMDGRSLGPDEESPLRRNALNGRVDGPLIASADKVDFPLPSAVERGNLAGQDVAFAVNMVQKNHLAESKPVINLEKKNPVAKSKIITKPAAFENSSVTDTSREVKQENDEENKRIKEEEELARKAEELRKQEETAKLKEQRRLEEKAKAKEAEERKRRNAEKAQARVELRAQKEAELKEKEREKKVRKKERKKEKVEAATGGDEAESVSRSENTQPETTQEPEIKENPKTLVKRPQKPSLLAKQIKPKVIPPPLRNRGKKRMQQWMWILLVVVVVIALFLVGNIGFSFKFGLPNFDF